MAKTEMTQVDLTQPVRDEDGTLYMPGSGVKIPAAFAKRLQEPLRKDDTATVRSGAVRLADAQEEADELPAVPRLADHIAEMDEAQVRSLMEQDDRKSAVPVYEKRLAELQQA